MTLSKTSTHCVKERQYPPILKQGLAVLSCNMNIPQDGAVKQCAVYVFYVLLKLARFSYKYFTSTFKHDART